MMQDTFSRDFAAAQAAGDEQARASRENVRVFAEMFLTLGGDCTKIVGTAHDAELAEAKGLAGARWEQLLNLEAQIQRDEAVLASRPKKRPSSSTDDTLPSRLLEKQDREWEEKTKYLHAALADLRKLAASERKELESFTAKRR